MCLKKNDRTARNTSIGLKLEKGEIFYILFCFLLYFIWSIAKELNYAPDEEMRYLIPEYIFHTGQLPDGRLPEIRNDLWGFSYAFYPNFLGPLLSAACMKVVSLFTMDSSMLVIAARFPSVLCGTAIVFFAFGIGKRAFGKRGAWIYTVLLSMIPQFVFLTSYVNNDIICILGSVVILFSWVSAFGDRWNIKNGLLLAVGIIIIALSYYNGYGWILASMILFVGFWLCEEYKEKKEHLRMMKIGLLISVVVLVGIGYFFIRNAVLYDGDFLGMEILNEYSEKYADPEWKPSARNTPKNLGLSVFEMLLPTSFSHTSWIIKVFDTFVGAFGYANVFLPNWIYGLYGILFVVMFMGVLGNLRDWVKMRKEVRNKTRKKTLLFYGGMIISFLTPIILCIYYSYAVDYQPQGRYCYPMIDAFFWFGTQGLLWLLKKMKLSESFKTIITVLFLVIVVSVTLFVTWKIYLPS